MAVPKISNSLELAKKVNLNLPVNVSTHLIETFPDFAETLSELTKYLSFTGSTLRCEKDLEGAEAELQSKKFQYLHYRVLYSELENMVLDYNSVAESDSLSDKVLGRLNKILPTSGVIGCLEELTKSGTILNFTSEFLREIIPPNDLEFQRELSILLKRRLQEISFNMFNIYRSDENGETSAADISHLPIKLDKELERAGKKSKELKILRATRQWQFNQYEKAMSDVIQLLQELIKKFRVQGPPEFHSRMANYLFLKARALIMKLRLLQLELVCDTYSKDVIPALRIIKDNLKQSACEKEHRLSQLQLTLDAYLSLGEEYTTIVAEYLKLKEETANKKWALNKLEEP